MDNDLLLPLFWMVVFGTLTTIGFRRLTKKLPIKKKWVRPDPDTTSEKKQDH